MTDNLYDLCLTEDFLLHMEEEAAEEQLLDSSPQPPEHIPKAPDEEPSPPDEIPFSIEQETLALMQEMTQLRASTQREIHQLLSLMEERSRKEADYASRNRREGRRCRSYGFIAGTALVMAAMPILTAAVTISWKALIWFSQALDVSPAALCASLFCVLLGIGTLKATKPLGDRIIEWLEDDEEV